MDTATSEIIMTTLKAGGVVAGLGLMAFFSIWVYKNIIVTSQTRTDEMVKDRDTMINNLIESHKENTEKIISNFVPKMDEIGKCMMKLKSSIDVLNANYSNIEGDVTEIKQDVKTVENELHEIKKSLDNKADKERLENYAQQLTELKLKLELQTKKK